MATKKKSSSKGTLKLSLSSLTLPLGELTLLQVLTTGALVRYEWESASPATEFEPPDYGSFDIVSIRVKEDCIFCDERGIATCKIWKNSELCEVLSEQQISAITVHCEALLRSGKAEMYVVKTKVASGKKQWYHEDARREQALSLGYRLETVDKFRSV